MDIHSSLLCNWNVCFRRGALWLVLFWYSQMTSTQNLPLFLPLDSLLFHCRGKQGKKAASFLWDEKDPERLTALTQSLALKKFTRSSPTYHCHSISGLGLVPYILVTYSLWTFNSITSV